MLQVRSRTTLRTRALAPTPLTNQRAYNKSKKIFVYLNSCLLPIFQPAVGFGVEIFTLWDVYHYDTVLPVESPFHSFIRRAKSWRKLAKTLQVMTREDSWMILKFQWMTSIISRFQSAQIFTFWDSPQVSLQSDSQFSTHALESQKVLQILSNSTERPAKSPSLPQGSLHL